MVKLYRVCQMCNGDGKVGEGGVQDCPRCGGLGYSLLGKTDYPGHIYPSYKVFECIDAGEYDGLIQKQQEGVRIILSLGMVDLSAETSAKTKLWNWFGEGTATRAALETLIS